MPEVSRLILAVCWLSKASAGLTSCPVGGGAVAAAAAEAAAFFGSVVVVAGAPLLAASAPALGFALGSGFKPDSSSDFSCVTKMSFLRSPSSASASERAWAQLCPRRLQEQDWSTLLRYF